VSLWSEDPDGPVELRFEGHGPNVSPAKVDHAAILIDQYLARCPERQARTEQLLAHTAAHGISERATERALSVSRKAGRLLSPTRGLYVLPTPV
jgi:hypothetical protein